MKKDQLAELRKRILAPWMVQRGSTVWAPWGKTGWSAVEIKLAQRKWAKGIRVKPHNGKEVAQGKVPLDRLIKRDPKKKGKDRPEFPPSEVFSQNGTKPPKKEKEPSAPKVDEVVPLVSERRKPPPKLEKKLTKEMDKHLKIALMGE